MNFSYSILSIKHLNKNCCIKLRNLSTKLTNEYALSHRVKIFEKEKEKQLKKIERIEKIEVLVEHPKFKKLIMNKNISTPFNCAMHLSETLYKQSALAHVDDDYWDMSRPLEKSCNLKFLNFNAMNSLSEVNNAYWRSCAFILGYILETSFKDDFFVELCSFPPPNIKSGSFIYDACLNIPNWIPSKDELRCLTIAAIKLIAKNLKFERLSIDPEIALEMFKYNKYKLEQIPLILKNKKSVESNFITVYKLGNYVDISKGPMIANTELIGRYEITGIFDLDTASYGKIKRVQGISIPSQLNLHYWTFNLLAEKASRFNSIYKPILKI